MLSYSILISVSLRPNRSHAFTNVTFYRFESLDVRCVGIAYLRVLPCHTRPGDLVFVVRHRKLDGSRAPEPRAVTPIRACLPRALVCSVSAPTPRPSSFPCSAGLILCRPVTSLRHLTDIGSFYVYLSDMPNVGALPYTA